MSMTKLKQNGPMCLMLNQYVTNLTIIKVKKKSQEWEWLLITCIIDGKWRKKPVCP